MKTEYGFCFRPAPGRTDCSGPLWFWVCCGEEICFYQTRYDIRHHEWDAVAGIIVLPARDRKRARLLRKYIENMKRDVARMEAIVRLLTPDLDYSAEDIVASWAENINSQGLKCV